MYTLPTLITRQRLVRSFHLLVTVLIGLVLVLPAQADGPAFLAKNINTTLAPVTSSIESIVAHGDIVYFNASQDGTPRLWRSDGTVSGTFIVNLTSINQLTNVNGTFFFTAADAAHGTELWKSNGAFTNKTLIKDIFPGPGNSSISNLINVNGSLFFTANDGSHGYELWKSDGTTAGTALIRDFTPGNNNFGAISNITRVGGSVFFTNRINDTHIQLWKSDGTATGTTLLQAAGAINNLTDVNGILFFGIFSGARPFQLWKSDGTATGTTMVKEIIGEDFIHVNVSQFVHAQGLLFFSAACPGDSCAPSLWRSDGTAAGTIMIKHVSANHLTRVSEQLFFVANDSSGASIWTSDGTSANTVLVKQITPAGQPAPDNLIDVNGTLFFVAPNQPTNASFQLWKSDGTAAGTIAVKTINRNPESGVNPYNLVNANGTLFFAADDGHGYELWKSDGTGAGTGMVVDLTPSIERGSLPGDFVDVNRTLFFTADDGIHGRELWKSNGTSASTVMVKDIVLGGVGTFISNLTNVNGTLFFTAITETSGPALWKSNGTTAGTVMVKAIAATQLTSVNGKLFFLSDKALWRSDGTAAGTVQLKQFSETPDSFIDFNGTLVFKVTPFTGPIPDSTTPNCCNPAADSERGLWKSDGTIAGTVFIKEDLFIDRLTQVDDLLFFLTGDETGNIDLWKSDGTAAGTAASKRFSAAPGVYTITFLGGSQGKLFFTLNNHLTQSRDLWKSDGTAAGTSLVKAVTNPYLAVDVNGTLLFATRGIDIPANNHFSELWKTDGTGVGTVLVKRFDRAALGNLLNVNGKLVFLSGDISNGQLADLWKSDGTTAGTLLMQHLDSGVEFLLPQMRLAGPYLWLNNDDHSGIGAELWAIRTAIDTFIQSPSLAGAPPSGLATVPIQYGNSGIASASALTLTATLHPALTYVSNTSGITPTVSGQTLTWRIANPATLGERNFTLSVRTPNAAYGMRYPITLTVTGASPDSYPTDNTATIQVMVARQVYLPLARR